ncbi:hypothetical protein chiPu_0024240, partial [Chiloscyllium punctatum]|nr:hypothetical protein [Chiloscyllium punctatum]
MRSVGACLTLSAGEEFPIFVCQSDPPGPGTQTAHSTFAKSRTQRKHEGPLPGGSTLETLLNPRTTSAALTLMHKRV